jgi:hypothetical protein
MDEITADWLSTALATRAPGTRVKSFEILKVKTGFTTIMWLRLDLNEAGKTAGVPEVLILKGGFEPHSRARARTYVMEAVGYRDLADLGLKMPKVFFVDAEPDRAQAIIIMEDLNQRGVHFFHGLQPTNYRQMEKRLTALAAFHAQTWDSPELQPGGRYAHILANGALTTNAYMESRNFYAESEWRELVTRPQGAASSVHFHDPDYHREGLLYLSKLNQELPNCIVHGDTHQGNLYEDPDGTPGFFDILPRREAVYHELAYTITCGLDPLDRREWEIPLVRHYLQEMARHGVELDFDETMYYYAIYLHLGYAFFLMNDPYFQTVSFNTIHMVRFSNAMIDHNTKRLLTAAIRDSKQIAVRGPAERKLSAVG